MITLLSLILSAPIAPTAIDMGILPLGTTVLSGGPGTFHWRFDDGMYAVAFRHFYPEHGWVPPFILPDDWRDHYVAPPLPPVQVFHDTRVGYPGVFGFTVDATMDWKITHIEFELVPIPEPSTMAMLGLGMVGLFAMWRRR